MYELRDVFNCVCVCVCVCVCLCLCLSCSQWHHREMCHVCAYALPTISEGAALSHCYIDLFYIQESRRVTNTGATSDTTIKTYTNNSKLTLAIINCIVNKIQTSIFVHLSQVISSRQYRTVLSHIADFPHIVQAKWKAIHNWLLTEWMNTFVTW